MMIRWAQELLGYQFSILHRSARMMIDVDGLTRRFGSVVALHHCVAALLHKLDQTKCPAAYDMEFVDSPALTKIAPSVLMMQQPIPVLTAAVVHACSAAPVNCPSTVLVSSSPRPAPPLSPSIYSVFIMLCNAPPPATVTEDIASSHDLPDNSLHVADSTIC